MDGLTWLEVVAASLAVMGTFALGFYLTDRALRNMRNHTKSAIEISNEAEQLARLGKEK